MKKHRNRLVLHHPFILFLTYLPNSVHASLRSKRFRRFFRAFEAFFAFWRREDWGERNTDGRSGEEQGRREKETSLPLLLLALSYALPNFRAFKKRKSFKPAESPTETLATQTRYMPLSVGCKAIVISMFFSLQSLFSFFLFLI